jgi:hypothetical protein
VGAVIILSGWRGRIYCVRSLLLRPMDRQRLLDLLILFPLFSLLLTLDCPTPLYPFHLLTTPVDTRATRNTNQQTVSTESTTARATEEQVLTCHKPSQVLQVLVPISPRIFHLYSDRRVRTDDKFAVPERSSVDTHQDPIHVFGGGKGFLDSQISVRQEVNYDNESHQLNYHPYSNYWPYWWRCWISLLEVHQ